MDRSGSVWHNAQLATGTARAITVGSGKAIIGSRVGQTTSTSPFYGDIQEIIILSGTVNQIDNQRIMSYLAIKYGQTLGNSQPNLFNSGNDTVWSTNRNTGYTNYVFGIGRDDATGLYQKQSVNQD